MSRAVERLITFKIKVCVYIIYVGALWIIILCIYKYTHMHVYLRKNIVFIYNINIYTVYK